VATMATLDVRSGLEPFRGSSELPCKSAVSANRAERARMAASIRQAGGHWFEPSTAHLTPRSQAEMAWLRGSNVSPMPSERIWCTPRCTPRQGRVYTPRVTQWAVRGEPEKDLSERKDAIVRRWNIMRGDESRWVTVVNQPEQE
jgi:hypothetical protein